MTNNAEREAEPVASAEKQFEDYVQSLIAKNPDIREIGERLSRLLDEDDFNTIEPMLLGLAQQREAFAWMTEESKYRLALGGNCKGAVPVHGKPSATAKIPLYTMPPKSASVPVERLEALMRNCSFVEIDDLAELIAEYR